MGATKIEFRLRVAIMASLIMLGFWAPWIRQWGIGNRFPLWAWLALEVSRRRIISSAVAAPLFLGIGALIAAKGVWLRTWGTAYLGSATVGNKQMLADHVLTDGPFRYMRNPLYLGSWCMFAAMSFLMPVTGAAVAMALLTVFLLRLILGEEAFLGGKLGQPYQEYLRSVPRLFPQLRALFASTGTKPSGHKPQWIRALLSQSIGIGTFITLAVFYWSYNNWLLVKVTLVCFGASLVIQAFLPRIQKPAPQTK